MSTLLFIIAAIAIIAWYSFTMKKIDREEAESLKTPGTALFLRNNFGEFVNEVLSDPENYVAFERTDQIRFAKKNSSNRELVIGNMMDFGGPVMTAVVLENNKVLFEMKFKKGTSHTEISNKLLPLF